MNEEILKKLEVKVNRRSFLRGSSLAAAAIVGVAAASPLVAFAQEPQQQPPQDDKSKDKSDKSKDGTKKQKDPYADDTSSDGSDQGSSSDETKTDAQGREYRTCPQCGFNMYRQGRTWTCENCGYSYVE